MKWLFLLFPLVAAGQPLPKLVIAQWDAPTNLTGVVGYQLNYSEQNFVQLPTHVTEYEFPDLNLSFGQPISIFSLGTTIPSTTNTIYVANYIAIHEESTNGVDWISKKVEQVTFERQPTSLIRVRLQLTAPNNTGN